MKEKKPEVGLYEVMISRPDPTSPTGVVLRSVYVSALSESDAKLNFEELTGHVVTFEVTGSVLVGSGPVNLDKILH